MRREQKKKSGKQQDMVKEALNTNAHGLKKEEELKRKFILHNLRGKKSEPSWQLQFYKSSRK